MLPYIVTLNFELANKVCGVQTKRVFDVLLVFIRTV